MPRDAGVRWPPRPYRERFSGLGEQAAPFEGRLGHEVHRRREPARREDLGDVERGQGMAAARSVRTNRALVGKAVNDAAE